MSAHRGLARPWSRRRRGRSVGNVGGCFSGWLFTPPCSSPPSVALRPRVCVALADARRIAGGDEWKTVSRFKRPPTSECLSGYRRLPPTSGGRSSTTVRVPGRVVRHGRSVMERWRVLRFARLVREQRMIASPPARSSPHSVVHRPRGAARSPMIGASLPGDAGGRAWTRSPHPDPREVRLEQCSAPVPPPGLPSPVGGKSSPSVRVTGRVVRRGRCRVERRERVKALAARSASRAMPGRCRRHCPREPRYCLRS
jgi:hypothetical protein